MNGTGTRERLVLAVVGNVQRAGMNPIEQAQAYQALKSHGLGASDIAKQVGLSYGMIMHYLGLLDLDGEIQDLIQHGDIPFDPDALKCLRDIADPDRRVSVARAAASNHMSGPGIVRMIKRMRMAKPTTRRTGNRYTTAAEAPKISNRERVEIAGGHWNMIAQIGYKPAAPMLVKAAQEVCEMCPLYETASHLNCQGCSAADLLRKITFNPAEVRHE